MKTHLFYGAVAMLLVGIPREAAAQSSDCEARLQSALGQLPPRTAVRQDSERAALGALGVQLRSGGCAAQAVRFFGELNGRQSDAWSLANLALSEIDNGEYRRAAERLMLVLGARYSRDAWLAEGRRAPLASQLQTARERASLAGLSVACSAPGATVWIAGAEVANAGDDFHVTAGPITIEVRANGYISEQVRLDLRAGASERTSVTLRAQPPVADSNPATAERSTPSAGREPGSRSDGVVVSAAPQTTTVTETHSHPLRPVAWVALGGAVVGVGLGVVGHVIGQPAADKWNSESMCTAASPTADCVEARNTAESMGVLRAAGFIGGGVLAATSIVFFIATPPRVETTTRTAFRCAPNLASPGLSCGGRF